jgi:hypothetical protein
MFQLVAALFAVVAVVCAALVAAAFTVKMLFHVIVLPFKLLFLPLIAIGFLLKVVLVIAAGAVVVSLIAAVVIPIVVLGIVIGIPVAILAALT